MLREKTLYRSAVYLRPMMLFMMVIAGAFLLTMHSVHSDVLDAGEPFSTQYSYCSAKAITQFGERCLQDLQFECAESHFKEAQQLLERSQVEDGHLSFRIHVGLMLSEAFQTSEDVLRYKIEELFDKFNCNSPNDKIKFEAVGDSHVCESVYEAK